MARYLDDAAARADGFSIVHIPEQTEFAILRDGTTLGVAHYRLTGDGTDFAAIDFDHTEVDPSLRGTGLSGVLAHRALSDDIVRGRQVRTSCWFMEGYLAKHPELLERE